MSKTYSRKEGLEQIEKIFTELSSIIGNERKFEEYNDEVTSYLQIAGTGLIDSKNIISELDEYDNETIDIILKKCIPIEKYFNFGIELSDDFEIVEEIYETKMIFNSLVMQDFPNLWLINNENKNNEEYKDLIDDYQKNVKSYTTAMRLNGKEQYNYKEIETSVNKTIKEDKRKLKKIKELDKKTVEAVFENKKLQKDACSIQHLIEKDRLQKEIERMGNIKKFVGLYFPNSGCKIISIIKLLNAVGIEKTPEDLFKFLDEKGNIDDRAFLNGHEDIIEYVSRIDVSEILSIDLDESNILLGCAKIGGGVGEHWVVIKSLKTIQSSDGKTKIFYEVENSSKNDENRIYTSEEPKNSKEGKIIEIVIYKRKQQ